MTHPLQVRWRRALFMLASIVMAFSTPRQAAADPLLMFVLGFAKNVIESTMEANARRPRPAPPAGTPPPPAAAFKAPSAMTTDDLRALVDDSFAYLSRAQRAEILVGLETMLKDPALAGQRDQIVADFMNVARQANFAHRQLDRLTGAQKREVARQFAANFRQLTSDQQQELVQQLRLRALPLPSDLNEMMLVALTGAS